MILPNEVLPDRVNLHVKSAAPNNPKTIYLVVRSHAEFHVVVDSVFLLRTGCQHLSISKLQCLDPESCLVNRINSHLLEQPSSRGQEITIVGEDVEKKEP